MAQLSASPAACRCSVAALGSMDATGFDRSLILPPGGECRNSEVMRIKLWQVGVITYGIVYFGLASAMEAENLRHSYPFAYVMVSMIAQTFLICGVFLFALQANPEFAKVWRWLFPLLVVEAAVGAAFDATNPGES